MADISKLLKSPAGIALTCFIAVITITVIIILVVSANEKGKDDEEKKKPILNKREKELVQKYVNSLYKEGYNPPIQTTPEQRQAEVEEAKKQALKDENARHQEAMDDLEEQIKELRPRKLKDDIKSYVAKSTQLTNTTLNNRAILGYNIDGEAVYSRDQVVFPIPLEFLTHKDENNNTFDTCVSGYVAFKATDKRPGDVDPLIDAGDEIVINDSFDSANGEVIETQPEQPEQIKKTKISEILSKNTPLARAVMEKLFPKDKNVPSRIVEFELRYHTNADHEVKLEIEGYKYSPDGNWLTLKAKDADDNDLIYEITYDLNAEKNSVNHLKKKRFKNNRKLLLDPRPQLPAKSITLQKRDLSPQQAFANMSNALKAKAWKELLCHEKNSMINFSNGGMHMSGKDGSVANQASTEEIFSRICEAVKVISNFGDDEDKKQAKEAIMYFVNEAAAQPQDRIGDNVKIGTIEVDGREMLVFLEEDGDGLKLSRICFVKGNNIFFADYGKENERFFRNNDGAKINDLVNAGLNANYLTFKHLSSVIEKFSSINRAILDKKNKHITIEKFVKNGQGGKFSAFKIFQKPDGFNDKNKLKGNPPIIVDSNKNKAAIMKESDGTLSGNLDSKNAFGKENITKKVNNDQKNMKSLKEANQTTKIGNNPELLG